MHGVPFNVAFSLDDATRKAWGIVFSELESGKKFNWTLMRFPDD